MLDNKEMMMHLEALKKGLFMMSPRRVRALSTHETEDLIEELELHVSRAIHLVRSSQTGQESQGE